jgi:hypothetical protein
MNRLRVPIAVSVVALALAVPALAHASPELCGLPLLPACPVPPPVPPPAPTTPTTTTPTAAPTTTPPLVDAGAQYDGRDRFHSYAVIGVSKDGYRLSAFDLGFVHGSCSNHDRYYSEFGDSIGHGAVIDAAGRVSYTSGFKSNATFITARGKLVKGREEVSFTIRFSAGRLDGTLHDTFRSATLRCSSGPVAFAAYPAGSAQAPLHDATTGTGRYTGQASGNGGAFSLRMFLPLRWITSLRVGWEAFCRNGYTFRSTSTLYLLPVTGSRFSLHTAGLVRADRHGLYERFRVRLTGRFFAQGAYYAVAGTWEWSDGVYRSGRRLGACSTGPVTFRALGPLVPSSSG